MTPKNHFEINWPLGSWQKGKVSYFSDRNSHQNSRSILKEYSNHLLFSKGTSKEFWWHLVIFEEFQNEFQSVKQLSLLKEGADFFSLITKAQFFTFCIDQDAERQRGRWSMAHGLIDFWIKVPEVLKIDWRGRLELLGIYSYRMILKQSDII